MAIPSAKLFTPVNEAHSQGGDAAGRGFQAQQHGQSGADVVVNNGRRYIPGTDLAPPDIQDRELRENQRVDAMAEKIKSIIGDDPAGRKARMEKLARETGLSDLMDNPFEMGAIRAAQQGHRQPINEDEFEAPEPAAPTGAWTVDAMTARTKAGATIPVWQVRDGRSGVKLPHPFRLMETASRVVAVLNRSGNINDPRIAQWVNIDKTRQSLIAKSRQLKEAIQAGNTSVKGQLIEIRNQLTELDLKIGI